MKIFKSFLILSIFFLIGLTGCSNNQIESGNRGVFSIYIGSSGSSARTLTDDEKAALTYIIRLTDGPAEDIERTQVGFGQVTFSVPVGKWTISVEAKDGEKQVAFGSTTANIKPGSNGTISITMKMSSGNVPIVVTLPSLGGGEITVSQDNFILTEGMILTITVAGAFDEIEWYIAGREGLKWNEDGSITLSADDFSSGVIYRLTVSVLVYGKWYSKEITFIVIKEETPPDGVNIVVILPSLGGGEITVSQDNFVLTEGASQTITVAGDFEKIEWYIAGREDLKWNEGGSITLSADDFSSGVIYSLTVSVLVDGKWYSKEIAFIVIKEETPPDGVPIDPILPKFEDIEIVLKNGGEDIGDTPITITEDVETIIAVGNANTFKDIKWYIAGRGELSDDLNGYPSISLSADIFDPDIYRLTVSVLTTDGRWYSREIIFIVPPKEIPQIILYYNGDLLEENSEPISITGEGGIINLEGDFDNIEWSIQEMEDYDFDGNKNGNSITLSSEDFDSGTYSLILSVSVDGQLFSREISFTVPQKEPPPGEVIINPIPDTDKITLLSDGDVDEEGRLTIAGNEATIYVEGNEHDPNRLEWSIVGREDLSREAVATYTLYADDFERGKYYNLTLFYSVDGVPYSKSIIFQFSSVPQREQ